MQFLNGYVEHSDKQDKAQAVSKLMLIYVMIHL